MAGGPPGGPGVAAGAAGQGPRGPKQPGKPTKSSRTTSPMLGARCLVAAREALQEGTRGGAQRRQNGAKTASSRAHAARRLPHATGAGPAPCGARPRLLLQCRRLSRGAPQAHPIDRGRSDGPWPPLLASPSRNSAPKLPLAMAESPVASRWRSWACWPAGGAREALAVRSKVLTRRFRGQPARGASGEARAPARAMQRPWPPSGAVLTAASRGSPPHPEEAVSFGCSGPGRSR